MEVVIPLLAAAGLILSGKNDRNQDSNMLNRETMNNANTAKQAKKEAFSNMGQDRINPQNHLPNANNNQFSGTKSNSVVK